MEISHPYLLFLGDVADALAAKTALGIVDWRPDWCVGQLRLPGCKADTGLTDMTVGQGVEAGAKTMIVGAVNAGGVLPDHWVASIVEALEAGLNVATGMHTKLADIPAIAEASQRSGSRLFDVRHTEENFETGKGTKRFGKRLLTVGTDCSVGKKYTALAIERGMRAYGFTADFCATGQTGVFISGRGASIDAVVADFISGAAEWLSPETAENHWQIVEGQGSLFHPSFAGVSLGLLHGSQPDVFVVCHEPTRTNMRGVPASLPSIQDVIDLTITCGKLTNPNIHCVGISVNTAALSEQEALDYLKNISAEYDLPACDPVRFQVDPIIERIASEYPTS